MLNGCEIQKESKKGFCFKIFHPEMKNIYSTKGLKGETLTSAKLPGSTDHCIIAVASEQDRTEWMNLIQLGIEKAGGQPEQHEVPPSPTLEVKASEDALSRSPSATDLKELPLEANPLKLNSVDIPEKTEDFPVDDRVDITSTKDSISGPKLESSPPSTVTELKDDKESGKIFSDPSSDEEDDLDGERKPLTLQVPPSPTKSIGSSSLEDIRSSINQATTIQEQIPSIQIADVSKKDNEEPKLNSEAVSTKSSVEKEEEEVVKTHVHYYKEGTLQIKSTKSWKEYWLIVKNGLLLYFENERVRIACVC